MASSKQRAASRRNIKKVAAVAKKKLSIAHLPRSTRTAPGKQAAKLARSSSGAESPIFSLVFGPTESQALITYRG